jgi:hypothetical protein
LKAYTNNLVQVKEKEAHENKLIQEEDDNANGYQVHHKLMSTNNWYILQDFKRSSGLSDHQMKKKTPLTTRL